MKSWHYLLLLVVLLPFVSFADHMDISGIVNEYKGAESCLICHGSGSDIDVEKHAKDFAATTHFQFKADIGNDNVYQFDGDADLANDVPVTGAWGKANRYCGLPGSITSINWLGLMQDPNPPFNANNATYPNGLPGGCARCHTGNGTLTIKQLGEENAWKTVDCLVCHVTTYQLNGKVLNNYGARLPVADTSSTTGYHLPYLAGDDLKTTSQSIVTKPTTNNCQNCHVWAGGGYTNKRGHDFSDEYGTNPIVDMPHHKRS